MPDRWSLPWAADAMGPLYFTLLLAAGLASFAVTCLVIYRGRGPMAVAAVLLAVFAPLLLGLLAMLHGLATGYAELATAVGAPNPAELFHGYAMSLAAPITAIIVSLPSYAVATVGSTVRSLGPRAAKK